MTDEYEFIFCQRSLTLETFLSKIDVETLSNLSFNSRIYIIVGLLSFSFLAYIVFRFSANVTKDINRMNHHTHKYKKAQGLDMKKKRRDKIKEDPIFKDIVVLIQKEKEVNGAIHNRVSRPR